MTIPILGMISGVENKTVPDLQMFVFSYFFCFPNKEDTSLDRKIEVFGSSKKLTVKTAPTYLYRYFWAILVLNRKVGIL